MDILQKKHRLGRYSSYTVVLVFLLFSLVGLFLVPRLTTQLSPSQVVGSLNVSCEWYGAPSDLVEASLCAPMESALAKLNGVKKIYSSSVDNHCVILVELDKWINGESFRFEASSLLRQIRKSLPEGAGHPVVSLTNIDMNEKNAELLTYIVHGSKDVNYLVEITERHINATLRQIDGIGVIRVSGGQPYEIEIKINANNSRLVGMNASLIEAQLRQELGSIQLGKVQTDNETFSLILQNKFLTIHALEAISLDAGHGRMISLGDIAKINVRKVPRRTIHRINGREVVMLSIFSNKMANTLALSAIVESRIASLLPVLPKDVKIDKHYDSSRILQGEITKIGVRTVLSVAILLIFTVIFLRKWQYIFVVISALLVNILVLVIFFYCYGVPIHLYSLAGMTLSIGLVIDNTILIIEDIRLTGKNRIFAAILASTLTALGALCPIFFLEEQHRLLLSDFALTIAFSLLISLPIAYFFVPAIIDQFNVVSVRPRKSQAIRAAVLWNSRYRYLLNSMLRYRMLIIIVCVFLFGLPLFLLPDSIEGSGFFAKGYNATFGSQYYRERLSKPINVALGGALNLFINREHSNDTATDIQLTQLYIKISMPQNAGIEAIDDVVKDTEMILANYQKGLHTVTSDISSGIDAMILVTFNQDIDAGFPEMVKAAIEMNTNRNGAADFLITGVGKGFHNAVDVNRFDSTITLMGYNYRELLRIAEALQDQLQTNPRVDKVIVSTAGRNDTKMPLNYTSKLTNLWELEVYGANARTVASSLKTQFNNGSKIGKFSDDQGRNYDIVLTRDDASMFAQWNVLNDPTYIDKHAALRLKDIAVLNLRPTAQFINRIDQEYVLHVHYRFIGSYELNKVVRHELLDEFQTQLPFGYKILSAQSFNKWSSDFRKFIFVIPLLLFFVYVICAVLFESFIKPLAVVVIIPFSLIGVFLLYYSLNLMLSEGTYAALLIVCALVTNNALYIVYDLNHIKMRFRSKITDDVRVYSKAMQGKASPIFVTTITAVLSLLPFLITGEETGFWYVVAVGTIGGLAFSIIGIFLFLPLCLISKKCPKINCG